MSEDKQYKGVFFRSDNDLTTDYVIEVCPGRFDGSAVVKLYTLIDWAGAIKSGDLFEWFDWQVEWIAEVELCGKYFFPKFDNELQLYYDDKKYYQGRTNTNSITSLMECINFAIEYGLKESNITPY